MKTGDKVYCFKNCIRMESISGQLGYTTTKYRQGRYYTVAGLSSKKIDTVIIYDDSNNHSFFYLKAKSGMQLDEIFGNHFYTITEARQKKLEQIKTSI